MRTATLIVFVLMVLSAVTVSAQTTPYIAVYFDQTYTTEALIPPPGQSCPGVGPGFPGKLYIALSNANMFVVGVEFAVAYPPEIVHVADFDTQPVTIGNTASGLSMAWANPQNGFSAVYICGVDFFWNCDGCTSTDIPMPVVVHPVSGVIEWVDFPGYVNHPAVGLTSLICATIPAEETTWGKVKALYE
ncbi:MAG: hypothetical protein JSW58_07775 [Candidatus Latescibacterota bacterium]|nr:MAG: hypothetical protein JSW58_07775 [Candidatus Latescibacterota bacterium]